MYRYIPLLDIITESILTEKLKPYKLVIKRKYVYGQYGSYMSVIKAEKKNPILIHLQSRDTRRLTECNENCQSLTCLFVFTQTAILNKVLIRWQEHTRADQP